MSLADEILALQSYPANASEKFREQLDMADTAREQQHPKDASQQRFHPARGIDRSHEFTPVERPSLLKAFARA